MDREEEQALLMASLERAAERLGDIAPMVAARFCARFPEAECALDTLWPGSRPQLEGQMVQTALHCIMHWIDSPGEIEVLLMGTVPHHQETLKVPPEWFAGFLTATAQVITDTIPHDRADERVVWEALVSDLLKVIKESAV
jgi:hypothetical protein